jgi:hypothetical protein
VVGIGDMNRDGRPDLVLQHRTSRRLAAWLMNGTTLADGRLLSPSQIADPQWDVIGVGDFNRDGDTDLALQHADGRLAVWFMNQTTLVDGQLLSHMLPDPQWRGVAVGDVNGDGFVDLVLHHGDTRAVAAWLLQGTQLIDGVLLSPSTLPAGWRIVGPR